MSFPSKKAVSLGLSICITILIYYLSTSSQIRPSLFGPIGWLSHRAGPLRSHHINDGRFYWAKVPTLYPVSSMVKPPSGSRIKIPKIQHNFPKEDAPSKKIRLERLAAVRETFLHSWRGYRSHAWLRDEVSPLSGTARDSLNGWAATLVDSLDTLWLMGLKDGFKNAVHDLSININFTSPQDHTMIINTFETNIRYLGGLLGAYDVSGGKYGVLLDMAVGVGEMLYKAFDTPNRMPLARWDWKS